MRKRAGTLLLMASLALLFFFLLSYGEKGKTEKEGMAYLLKEYRQEEDTSVTTEEVMEEPEEPEQTTEKPEATDPPVFPQYDGEMDCILTIPAIGLEQPVIRGNEEYNLAKKLLVCQGTLAEGENYTIMGHNLYAGYVTFASLHRLSIGDEVSIEQGDKTINYTVTARYESLARDSEKIFLPGEQNTLTLLTCTTRYRVGDTKYLVVKCTKEGENID